MTDEQKADLEAEADELGLGLTKIPDLALTVEVEPGDDLHDATRRAWEKAQKEDEDVYFDFNGIILSASAKETWDQCKKNVGAAYGYPVLTREEAAERNRREMEETRAEWARKIAEAGVATEEQMRDAEVPWPEGYDELEQYVRSLVERPHDYGTCVYAMSMAAQAAYNFVANQLGVTGFQASMADLDFLRRTRSLKGAFRVNDYSNLLYPQYVSRDHFPTALDVLQQQKEWLKEEATEILQDEHRAPNNEVRKHLLWLSMGQPEDSYAKALRSNYANRPPRPEPTD